MRLRQALWSRGLRYRVNFQVPGAPRRTIDIAFPSAKLAVFVDGCFWHQCPVHSVPAKNNSAWWRAKLEKNVERDRDTNRLLEGGGWTVLRLWEHESVSHAVDIVISTLQQIRQVPDASRRGCLAVRNSTTGISE